MTTIEHTDDTSIKQDLNMERQDFELDRTQRSQELTTQMSQEGQQSQPHYSTQKKKKFKKRLNGKNAYSIIQTGDRYRKIHKVSPKNSALNSTLSYFPSLKCSTRSNNSPSLKNSNNTHRSVMESTVHAFNSEYLSSQQMDSNASFQRRKSDSLPPKRTLRGNAEKDRLGREKLNKFHNKKHTHYQLNLLKNRINRLAYEEAKAQKKIDETKKRAESFMQTRYKFNVDQSIKNNYQFKMQQETEANREKFRQQRRDSYERIKQAKLKLIEKNLQDGFEVKQNLRHGFTNRDLRMSQDRQHKLSTINHIKNHHQNHSISKNERVNKQNEENKSRFDSIVLKDEAKTASNIKQMTKLERHEQELMERLKNTLEMHQQTVSSFEHMV